MEPTESLEDQLIELQSRQAFQDDSIQSLSDELAKQQLEIERLGRMVKLLSEQLKQVGTGPTSNPADEPPPPHY
ncbi:SlyX protein [Motiliproteus coralliicola]|uniref:Protein SlyX homolog n=1 Tax=Motiliproteus coralliicola TaxID=2283196 RepID=A0A369WEZ2_9GAMM|nr:SlyX family protein [Motiliproteus coralliicola]RDE19921.1 SlyX protein [Motiliproteus coralliicola]